MRTAFYACLYSGKDITDNESYWEYEMADDCDKGNHNKTCFVYQTAAKPWRSTVRETQYQMWPLEFILKYEWQYFMHSKDK
jgi:SRSO17 transposase